MNLKGFLKPNKRKIFFLLPATVWLLIPFSGLSGLFFIGIFATLFFYGLIGLVLLGNLVFSMFFSNALRYQFPNFGIFAFFILPVILTYIVACTLDKLFSSWSGEKLILYYIVSTTILFFITLISISFLNACLC